MKRIISLVFFLCFMISLFFTKSIMNGNKNISCGRINCHGGVCPYDYKSSEGTDENPAARKIFEWIKYRNPRDFKIPKNIHYMENQFVNNLHGMKKSAMSGNSLQWEYRGPYGLGGRIRAIGLDVNDENIMMAAGVTGGMWKTTNGGQSWHKTTAPNQLHNISCVVQNKTAGQRNIWYYGTGEGFAATIPTNLASAINIPMVGVRYQYHGNGIYKSTDYGETWTVLPSTLSNSLSNISPFDFIIELETFGTDGIMAATSNGIFMSTNGGSTWNNVLSFGANYNSSNIEITSDGIFYASIGGEGPHNGIYKSLNGTSWQKISNSSFPTSVSNIVIALSPSNQNNLYAVCALSDDQHVYFYKYDGNSWTDMSNNFYGGNASAYGGNMLVLKIKPDDPNTIFIGTIGLSRSTDGGNTFEIIAGGTISYADQQSILFSRTNPNTMIIGNDGGIWKTTNNMAVPVMNTYGHSGIDFTSLTNNLKSSQFYTIATSHGNSSSDIIVGGLQDRGCYITNTSNSNTPWEMISGGDGGFTAVSNDGQYSYTSTASQHSIMRWSNTLSDPSTFQFTHVTPANTQMISWLSPMILDAHDSRIMYIYAADMNWRNGLYRNSNLNEIPQGNIGETSLNWDRLTNVNMAASDKITAFGMSAASPRRLYFTTYDISGTSSNHIYKIENPHVGQPAVQEVNYPQSAEASYLHCICVDPLDVNKVTIAFSNYEIISIYHSTDGGNTWTPVAGNLEEFPNGTGNGPSVRWVSVLYVQNKPIYFAATSVGLFSTTRLNGMNTAWTQESPDVIGNVPVDMIDVRQSDGFVVVGTMGNGVYSTHVTEISTPLQVNLNASCNPANGGTINGIGTFDINSPVTITAIPNTGYRFVNWTENGNIISTSATYSFSLTSNRNLIANFQLMRSTVTLNTNPSVGGIVNGGGSFDIGANVTITATANSGYRFVSWTENGSVVSTNSSYTFTLSSDRNLVANFERIPSLTTSADFINVTANAGSGSFMVSNITGGTLSWTATSNESWLTITQGSSGNIYGSYSQIIEFSYSENSGAARVGIITITSDGTIGSPKTFEVRQAVATEISDVELPTTYELFQNYPNPFNPSTTITYQIPEAGFIYLKLYNALGKEIVTLSEGYKQQGRYKLTLNMSSADFSSGIYLFRLKAKNYSATKKLLLIK